MVSEEGTTHTSLLTSVPYIMAPHPTYNDDHNDLTVPYGETHNRHQHPLIEGEEPTRNTYLETRKTHHGHHQAFDGSHL